MATWEYSELVAESVTVSDDGDWVTKAVLTWHAPSGEMRAMDGAAMVSLNRLGGHSWELVDVTRVQLEDRFQIKVVTTYVLKRALRRRPRPGAPYEAEPIPA